MRLPAKYLPAEILLGVFVKGMEDRCSTASMRYLIPRATKCRDLQIELDLVP